MSLQRLLSRQHASPSIPEYNKRRDEAPARLVHGVNKPLSVRRIALGQVANAVHDVGLGDIVRDAPQIVDHLLHDDLRTQECLSTSRHGPREERLRTALCRPCAAEVCGDHGAALNARNLLAIWSLISFSFVGLLLMATGCQWSLSDEHVAMATSTLLGFVILKSSSRVFFFSVSSGSSRQSTTASWCSAAYLTIAHLSPRLEAQIEERKMPCVPAGCSVVLHQREMSMTTRSLVVKIRQRQRRLARVLCGTGPSGRASAALSCSCTEPAFS